jgi:S-adenosylmethionine synthetase
LAAILRDFNLRHIPALNKGPFYRKFGGLWPVGRLDLNLPWEVTDKAEMLKER